MTFDVAADAYDRFMGGWSRPLSGPFADFAGVTAGQRALDVGCGPGNLLAALEARLGAGSVAAVDPSSPFVAAARARHPAADVRQASAESLPYPAEAFDAALAQLVVHFMADAVAGLREMARVTRRGGVVAACVWDHASGRGPVSLLWTAARELDPSVADEGGLAGARAGHLGELLEAAGLSEIDETELSVEREFTSFDEWWEPYTRGVGPAGGYVVGLAADRRAELRERCRSRLPEGPFTLRAVAWAARAVSAGR